MAPAFERVFVAQPVPIGGGSIIAAPFQWRFDGEDSLFILHWSSRAGRSLFAQGRMLRPDGTIEVFRTRIPVTADRMAHSFRYWIGAGYLQNFCVQAAEGVVLPGELFVRVDLMRGLLGNLTPLGTIVQGYVGNEQTLAFPGSPIQLSTEGQGVLREFTGTDPAAGMDMQETVPTGARWELVSFSASLVPSAAAGNRIPWLQLRTALGGIKAASVSPIQIAPFTVSQVTWSQGMPLASVINAQSFVTAGLPTNPILLAGNFIETVTINLDVADNWGAPQIVVREWLVATL